MKVISQEIWKDIYPWYECEDYKFKSLRPSDIHVYVSVQHTNIASGNGLSPILRQAIIWTNAVILPIRPLGTLFSEIFF